MSVSEAIKILENLDLLDEENAEVLFQIKQLLKKAETNSKEKIKKQVAYLESIAIDFPEGTTFNDEDLY